MVAAAADEQAEFGRVCWRCRRGMKELDVLLSHYADTHYLAASPEEREIFRRLLESEDDLIYGYCFGRLAAPSPEVAALIARITAGLGKHR